MATPAPEMLNYGMPTAEAIEVSFISTAAFLFTFLISYIVLFQKNVRFRVEFEQSLRGDWCSRVNSTLHTIIIVPMILITVPLVTFNKHLDATTSIYYLKFQLGISVGYFIADGLIIGLFRVPSWGIFLIHHCVAITPYILNLWFGCDNATVILNLFLLVEFSNLSLNAQVFLEQTGRAHSRLYAAAFYTTFIGWIVCRLALPSALVYLIFTRIRLCKCLIPAVVSAIIIVLFCYGVFFFVLCKELRDRWRVSPKPEDFARVPPGIGDLTDDQIASSRRASMLMDMESGEEAATLEESGEGRGDDITRQRSTSSIEWALGIDRPESVMRHGGNLLP